MSAAAADTKCRQSSPLRSHTLCDRSFALSPIPPQMRLVFQGCIISQQPNATHTHITPHLLTLLYISWTELRVGLFLCHPHPLYQFLALALSSTRPQHVCEHKCLCGCVCALNYRVLLLALQLLESSSAYPSHPTLTDHANRSIVHFPVDFCPPGLIISPRPHLSFALPRDNRCLALRAYQVRRTVLLR